MWSHKTTFSYSYRKSELVLAMQRLNELWLWKRYDQQIEHKTVTGFVTGIIREIDINRDVFDLWRELSGEQDPNEYV